MIYYIANTGTGSGTTQHDPAPITILKNLIAGDTAILLEGEYLLNDTLIINARGEEDNPVVITSLTQAPILNFIYSEYGKNGVEVYGNYVQIKNIRIHNAGYKGLFIHTSHSSYENIEVAHSIDSGIQLLSGGNTLKNCMSHDNFNYRLANNFGVRFGWSSDGFSDKLYQDIPNTYINCISWNNTDDGFDFFGRVTNGITEMTNCIAICNGRSLFNVLNIPRYNVDKEYFDQYVSGKVCSSGGKKYLITLDKFPAFGNGNGFKLGGQLTKNNIKLINCIAAGNKQKGFDQNNNLGDMILVNCHGEQNKGFNFGFIKADQTSVTFEQCSYSEGGNYIGSMQNNLQEVAKYINCRNEIDQALNDVLKF